MLRSERGRRGEERGKRGRGRAKLQGLIENKGKGEMRNGRRRRVGNEISSAG